MRPIYIKPFEPYGKVPLCGSHFWGNPDLPENFDYPTYTDEEGNEIDYQFVCQINLSEVARYDSENRLPHKGLLLFFAKIYHYLGYYGDEIKSVSGYISDPDDVKVLYFPEVDAPGKEYNFSETVLVDAKDEPINPKELGISFAEGRGRYDEDHALLAEPTHREWESWDTPYEDWQILLQVDSFSGKDFYLNFMDCGVLDFLISPEALADGRFDDVRAIVLST